MPSYADRNRSLLYALSDFWTQIFADSDTVESVYRGAETLIGQIYLDLLGDMLNMSVRDTALFRKELFRMIRLREDTILRAPDGRFRVPLGPDVVVAKTLHNKVFAVTNALENGPDFVLLEEGTSLFRFDPTAAHPSALFGAGASAMRITGAIAGADFWVELVDDGSTVVTPELDLDAQSIYGLRVRYDSAAHTSVAIASALTSDPVARTRVRAEALVPSSPAAPAASGPTRLSFGHGAPLEGFGARVFPATFGSKFFRGGGSSWVDASSVSKGDILRLEPGGGVGAPVEVPLALVRDGALYSHFAAAPSGSETSVLTRREFTVLRSPADPFVAYEPWVANTVATVTGAVDPVASTLTVPGLTDAQAYDLLTGAVFLAGARNAGPVLLESWDPVTESFALFGASLAEEATVPVLLATDLVRVVSATGPFTLTPVAGVDGAYDLAGIVTDVTYVGATVFFTDDLTVAGVRARAAQIVDATTLRIDSLQGPVPGGLVVGVSLTLNVLSSSFATPLELDTPDYVPGEASELRTAALEGSVVVRGRRLLDGRALDPATDWTFSPGAGIRWNVPPDLRSGVTFEYEVRQVVCASRDAQVTLGFAAALAPVSATDARVMLYDLTSAPITYPWSIGDRIELDAGTGAPNTGTYYVDEILSGGRVVLGGGHTPVLPEPNDGSLGVVTWPTGTLDVEAPQERVIELAVWAPDIRVDRMSLASTYGYLLDRIEPSSEAYRSTLRGLMQLYMLGPTIARLEAAVHVLSGLPVVRDDGELVLRYERDVIATGTDLVLEGEARRARLVSGEFPAGGVAGYLVVTSGFNAGRVFEVETSISASELLLLTEPFTDAGASWEVVGSGTHAVVTDRNRYALPITIPFRAELTDSASFGTLRLPAFSTFTDAVQVQDEIGTPGWWQSARIPAALWPGQSAARLQSSPDYVEHVIGPVDDVQIGDPSFRIGTDDLADSVPRTVLASETGDGTATLFMDPHAPFSYEHARFVSSLLVPSVDEVGYAVRTWLPDGTELELPIYGLGTGGGWRVGLPMTLPGGSIACPDWQLVVDTAVLRHNTAFVVFDRYLKQHTFSVQIDTALLGRVDSKLLREIQGRLREVKPAHTYMLLSPSSTFTDVLGLTDMLERERDLLTSGAGGDALVLSPNTLRIGDAWRIGDFFRFTDWERTDPTSGPAPRIAESPPDYFTDIHNLVWTSGVTRGGEPTPLTLDLGEEGFFDPWFIGTASISAADAGGGAWVTFVDPLPPEVTPANVLLSALRLSGGTSQPGVYRIGRVRPEDNAVRIYLPGAVAEAGITARIESTMVFSATLARRPNGMTTLEAPVGALPFFEEYSASPDLQLEPLTAIGLDGTGLATGFVDPAAPLCFVRSLEPGVWEAGYIDNRYNTSALWPATVTATGTRLVLPPDSPLERQFTPDMGRLNREQLDYATSGARTVGVMFAFSGSSGDNVNQYRMAVIEEVFSPYEAVIVPANSALPIVDQVSSPFRFWTVHAAALPAAPVTIPVRFMLDEQRRVLRGVVTDAGSPAEVWQDSEVTVPQLLAGYVDTAEASFHAYGRMSPVNLTMLGPDTEQGDTYFTIGGLSPSLGGLRRRGQRDFDITELPIQISRRNVLYVPVITNGDILYTNGVPTETLVF